MADTHLFFDNIFNNAKANAIMIMDENGIVDRVNTAFTTSFGYTTDDLKSKHIRVLYIEKDQLTRRPEIELNQTHREGSSSDENYLVHKDGTPIWVTGESVLVKSGENTCIVKLIHNIHAQKQLERYLLNTSELLESLFNSVHQSGLLILDATLKVVKMNEHFRTMFQVTEQVPESAKLQQINHPFWSSTETKNDIRNAIVNATTINKEYVVDKGERNFQRIHITSKTMMDADGSDKRILLVIQDI